MRSTTCQKMLNTLSVELWRNTWQRESPCNFPSIQAVPQLTLIFSPFSSPRSRCRIVMRCESACKVIEPLRSRCLGIRVPAPTHDEVLPSSPFLVSLFSSQTERHAQITAVLQKVARKENIKLPEGALSCLDCVLN